MKTTDERFYDDVGDQNILVMFCSKTCEPCKQLEERFRIYAKKFIKADVDDCPRIAQHFNVRSLPTTIVFMRGQPVKTLIGNQPISAFK